MNSQLFFLLNAVIGIAFIFWFLGGSREGGRTSTRLKGDKPAEAPKFQDPQPESSPQVVSSVAAAAEPEIPRVTMTELREAAAKEERARRVKEAKPLNVLFIYNGHDWDAFEVLGLPAGASLPIVTQRYQELIQKADAGQLEFYGAAYQAILKKI